MKNDRFGQPGSHKSDRFGGLTYRHLVEYRTWAHMMARCHNPKHPQFKNYGARGIRVCKKWFDNFPAFLRDVGLKPAPKLELDRINNSKGYSPTNVRWTTRTVQMGNTRYARRLTYRGRTQAMSAWAREIGITYQSLAKRLRVGWTVAEAVTLRRLPGPRSRLGRRFDRKR